MKHSLKDWIFATRPWSLTASSMPALVAFSYVFFISKTLDTDINWIYGIIALIGAVIFQVSGNLLNDYFDYKFNVDRKETYSSRTLVDGIFSAKSIFIFGIVALLAGVAIGIFLLVNTGWHLLWIGALGVLGAYFYNRMKYIALGDLTIFIIYGLLIALGIGYVMTGQLLWQILVVVAPVGLIIVGILHANNTRDMLNDKIADIKTQAMIMGLRTSKIYFIIFILGAYLWVVVLMFFRILSPLSLMIIFTIPSAMKCIREMSSVEMDNLDSIKNLTVSVAQLVMLFSLLYSLANFIAGMLR